jgi:hypothetical protein
VTASTLRPPDPSTPYWQSRRAPHIPAHRLLGWDGALPVVCDPDHPYRPGSHGYAVNLLYLIQAEPLWCRKCCRDMLGQQGDAAVAR